jgi:predicted small lipoprotein YifL
MSSLDGCSDQFLYCAMSYRVLLRMAVVLCLLTVVLSGVGCGSKGPQYPEEHARYVRLDKAVEALRNAYVRRDLSAMEALMLPSDSLDRMVSEASKDFQQFEDISLDFSIERVLIEGDQIDVFLHWQGQWKQSAAETGVRDRGHGLLRWTGAQSPLLSDIGGDLPFGMAVRHIVPRRQPSNAS